MKNIRIACSADLHLGRRLLHLPEGLEEYVQAPKMAWERFVDYICDPENRVDACVLAGDLFDNEQNLYESIAVFERGVRKILARHIPIIAVAGNHDALILGRFAKRIESPYFYLLGSGGNWETLELTFQGRKIQFVGWSFPSPKMETSPLATYPRNSDDILTIGLLHCDAAGGKESPYAPVEFAEFQKLKPKAWVLGHIHIPGILIQEPLVFYCGSLQGLDPSEKGIRGGSILEVSPTGEIVKSELPLAPLLWHNISINLSHLPLEELDAALCRAAQTSLRDLPRCVEAALCRFTLEGRTSLYPHLQAFSERVEGKHFTDGGRKGIPCYIESVQVDCRPDVDLEVFSRGHDLAALLARTLKNAQVDGFEKEALLEEAQQFLRKALEKSGNIEDLPNHDELHESLLQAGFEALDMMLAEEG